MREIPLDVVLSWPTPNYKDPETRGGALLITNIILIILVTLAVFARVWGRTAIKKYYGIDDTMILLAWACTVGMTAIVLLANRKYGWNRHVWDVEFSMIQNANIIAFVAKLMYLFATGFTRLSLLCLYYRLVRDVHMKWYRWTLHASLAFVIGFWISMSLLAIFDCYPVEVYWLFPATVKGHCGNEGNTTLIAGILSCVADLICTCLPIPVVMRLQMPLRQRLGVCFLLCLGFIVTIAGIVRTFFIYKSLIATYDETWFTYPLWIAAAVEVDLAVLCACAPALKSVIWNPFIHRVRKVSVRMNNSRKSSQHLDSVTIDEPFRRPESSDKLVQIPLRDLDSVERGPESPTSDGPRTGRLASSERDAEHRTWASPSNKSSRPASGSERRAAKLEIHKETSFKVSNTPNKDLPSVPAAEEALRAKSRPLIPGRWRPDGTREEDN
nr:hypothetical protein B0A51_11417 [Rachicladosporium sp. CCFEE 5018]OQO24251.1 hypothetical protein B0A51_08696 [Rachicladosporium sp. CCFEE 5018]